MEPRSISAALMLPVPFAEGTDFLTYVRTPRSRRDHPLAFIRGLLRRQIKICATDSLYIKPTVNNKNPPAPRIP